MLTINFRQFETRAAADAYRAGYASFPRWPRVGVNGSAQDALQGSFEAMGYYDAEREEEERHDRHSS